MRGPLEINTKVMGGRSDIGWNGKAATWHDGWGPAPVSPSAPSWDDGPDLARALVAGAKAIERQRAAGFNRRLARRDGRQGCGHCYQCSVNRQPDRCHGPVELNVAAATAGQLAADGVVRDLADAAEIQRIIWAEQARRGVAF